MPLRYSGGIRSANTAATANHVAFQFWNPSTTRTVRVMEVRYAKQGAATLDAHMLIRSTAKGATPATTVTPDIDNNYDRFMAHPSVSLLESALFGTQPTLATPELERTSVPAALGAGYAWTYYPDGIIVPPGTGLCAATPTALILIAGDFTVIWDELSP